MIINSHVTGLNDLFAANGLPEKFDFLPDCLRQSARAAWKRAWPKYVPYSLKEYVVYPACVGPTFWEVLLGTRVTTDSARATRFRRRFAKAK